MSKELELPVSEVIESEVTPGEEQLKLLSLELARLFGQEKRIDLGSNGKNLEKSKYLIEKSLKVWGENSRISFRSKLIACISSFGKRQNRVGKIGAERIVDEALSRITPLLDITETTTTDIEKQFVETRLGKYANEYEFNESSDVTLLRQLVSLEYIAWRLEFAQRQDWQHPQKYSQALKNTEDRMMKLMEKLGVARFQRDDEEGLAASNIAELAQSLESKEGKIKEDQQKDIREIDMFNKIRERDGRDEVNLIPETEYDALEKKISEMEVIDPSKYFDVEDLSAEDIEKMIGGNIDGSKVKEENKPEKG